MTANIVNQVAFLRTSREFPEEIKQLTVEVNKAYIDTATAVNNRIIGIFSTNRPAITGEAWFITNQKQQTLRQAYVFTSTADIRLGFKISAIPRFTRTFGEYTDATTGNWYGLIPGTSVAIPGQISFFIFVDITSTTSDLIRFVVGAGAPPLSNGNVVIEWMSVV